MGPRALLLDFGGTLDSDGVHWSTIYARALEAAGLHLPRELVDRAFLASERALEKRPGVARLGLGEHVTWQLGWMLQDLHTRTTAGDEELTPDVQPSPAPTPSLLQDLARRILGPVRERLERSRRLLQRHRPGRRLALVSNFTPNLPLILGETGLDRLLDAVLCSAIEGVKKPDHTIFLRALERLGAQPAEAAMVGDSLASDIIPARELGLTTVWIRGDRVFVPADASAAQHTVGSLEAALELLCGPDHSVSRRGG
jgi:putative hydrolase of the HAD superfamily